MDASVNHMTDIFYENGKIYTGTRYYSGSSGTTDAFNAITSYDADTLDYFGHNEMGTTGGSSLALNFKGEGIAYDRATGLVWMQEFGSTGGGDTAPFIHDELHPYLFSALEEGTGTILTEQSGAVTLATPADYDPLEGVQGYSVYGGYFVCSINLKGMGLWKLDGTFVMWIHRWPAATAGRGTNQGFDLDGDNLYWTASQNTFSASIISMDLWDDRNVYVDHVNGSDSNHGRDVSSALKTVAAADNHMAQGAAVIFIADVTDPLRDQLAFKEAGILGGEVRWEGFPGRNHITSFEDYTHGVTVRTGAPNAGGVCTWHESTATAGEYYLRIDGDSPTDQDNKGEPGALDWGFASCEASDWITSGMEAVTARVIGSTGSLAPGEWAWGIQIESPVLTANTVYYKPASGETLPTAGLHIECSEDGQLFSYNGIDDFAVVNLRQYGGWYSVTGVRRRFSRITMSHHKDDIQIQNKSIGGMTENIVIIDDVGSAASNITTVPPSGGCTIRHCVVPDVIKMTLDGTSDFYMYNNVSLSRVGIQTAGSAGTGSCSADNN